MPSEKRAQKILSWWRITHSAFDWLKQVTNQKNYPDLVSDTSSVWNFCARSSDVISRENRWLRGCFLKLLKTSLYRVLSWCQQNNQRKKIRSWMIKLLNYKMNRLSTKSGDKHSKIDSMTPLFIVVNSFPVIFKRSKIWKSLPNVSRTLQCCPVLKGYYETFYWSDSFFLGL